MRVGIISPPWISVPPAAYGGIEAVVHTLACALVAAGHDVLLAASGDSSCPVPRVPGFPAANANTVGLSLYELRHVMQAYPAMRNVDIVHDHTLAGPFLRDSRVTVPIVTTVHGPFVPEMLDVYRRRPAGVHLVAVSHHQASTARDVVITRVIHHGLETADIPVGRGDGGYACFLGRLHPDKGVVQAIAIARGAGMSLRIAAKMRDAAEQEYFTTSIRPLLGPGCEFLGELNTADKFALLGGAAVLINSIQWDEPFGMVMIESLATGTPVVTTPRGSAPEIVDDGRTGFIRADKAGLVDAVQRVTGLDRGLCRRTAEERFSAKRMASEHIALYAQVLSERRLPERRPHGYAGTSQL